LSDLFKFRIEGIKVSVFMTILKIEAAAGTG
jgi:hypothetical protein